MKIFHSFFLAAALTLGASLSLAQNEQKPAPPAPPPPAPDTAQPPPSPGAPNGPDATPPGGPGHEGRHHEHRDGSSRPAEEGRPEGWHRPGWPMPMPMPTKPTPYIGVITAPPTAALSSQLSLPDGFGLVVSDVLPDSPAAKAGVQRYDVLTKFNDQQLVDSGQFSTLVRALKKGGTASVTLIRKAQEQKVTVTIDERMLPERRSFPIPGGDMRHMHGEIDRPNGPEGPHSFGEKMRMYQEHMKSWQTGQATGAPGQTADGAPPIPPEDILREVRPGGVAQIRLLRPDGAVTYNMANARLVMKDDTGEIELTTKDGKRSLLAKNAQGDTLFDGPIDTEEQRKALPEDVRKKLEMIEVQRKLAEAPQSSVDSALLPDVQ